jgi:hypothetical protein
VSCNLPPISSARKLAENADSLGAPLRARAGDAPRSLTLNGERGPRRVAYVCVKCVAAMDKRDQWTRPASARIAAATFSAAGLEEEDKRLRAEDKRFRAAPVAQAPSPVEEQLATDARRAKIERASEKARRMSPLAGSAQGGRAFARERRPLHSTSQARIDRPVDKRRAWPPPSQAAFKFAYCSGSPALRMPSITAGRFGECSFTHLIVIAGLRRRASVSSAFASSILPACA